MARKYVFRIVAALVLGGTSVACLATRRPARPAEPSAVQGQPEPSGRRVASWPAAGGGVCRPAFSSGLNVAWIHFAADVPNPDIPSFTKLFQDTYASGGRVVRWWFHTNGAFTPGYDASGLAKPISDSNIADVKKILDAAHAAHVMVDISLWSFDMLQGPKAGGNFPPEVLDANEALLKDDTRRQAYIDRVLTPLVTALKGHPGLFSWEIFNEPEGMTRQNGWTGANGGRQVDKRVIQKCVNWFADAIHAVDPAALVTNGSWTFIANSNAGDYHNLYSDQALVERGGRPRGTLDYYQVHYYDNWGKDNTIISPFKHPAVHWRLDDGKPLVIGEFWAIDTNGLAAADLYTSLYDNGYNGAWAWQYWNADEPGPPIPTKWPAMQAPMQNMLRAHATDVKCPGDAP
jgi:hypothetical protein